MNSQDLKNSILQLAIKGKLGEQRKEEGTAKELLEQIKAAKDQLIKEKKIKKQKALPEIKEDEIPFDIPESWVWVRFGEIVNVVSARRIHQSDWRKEGIPFYRAREIGKLAEFGNVDNELFIDEELFNKFAESGVPKAGDLMVTAVGTLGKTYIVQDDDIFYYKDASVICLENFYDVSSEYIKLIMESKLMEKQIKSNSGGTTVSTLTMARMNMYCLPLPPLEEQKRIVAKIEELLPYVDKYDVAYSEVEELNKKFPEDMQKSILQYAVQGKLVEQREEEGTAEDLYQQIQEEKEKLVKEGKVKKTKALPEIAEDEIPYDIPGNWKWVRLGDIFEINPRNSVNDGTTVSFIPMALIEDGYRSEFSYETKSWGEVKKGYTHFRDGDIVMAKITPCFQNLKSAIMLNLENDVGAGTTELHVLRAYNDICLEFFLWFIKSPIFVSTCVSKMTGTAGQQRVGTATITNYVTPLPPLEEQRRIVSKIEEILPHCKQLVK
ncbi:restriction endonuclease subunit S [Pseudalkalibacillus sp. JSM 102089]|uniref:restriction endonuclease subunit S n=1 Tax=Pseudalkalibacillus sp. JSM 102089 TaxID=3229856 RepID=UPI0035257880